MTVEASTSSLPGAAVAPGGTWGPGSDSPFNGSVVPPAPAEGLELLGTFDGSGHRDAPSLVRRPDGQVVQLTPLLYKVLEEIDGRRDAGEIARRLQSFRSVTPADVRLLIDSKLRPLGLVQTPGATRAAVPKANPLLALHPRLVLTDPNVTRRIAWPLSGLFFPPVVLAFVLGFTAAAAWLLFEKGLGPAMREALYEPGSLLLVFGLTMLSAGFHELGHAAACIYGGGRPGAMGVGLYLLWPAFYTDVTDAYRLSRRDRLRVDLGGLYFNAVFAVGAVALWSLTRWEPLLLVIPLQALQMVRQLIPLVRLDGYHILADLTGVPDLFAHIKTIVTGMLPTHRRRRTNKIFKPWVRAVVTLWVLIVVPLFAAVLIVIAWTLPRVMATGWDSLGRQWTVLTADVASMDLAGAGVTLLGVLALAVPLLSFAYLLARVLRRLVRHIWQSTTGRPVRRAMAGFVAAAVVAALAMAWWPRGQYRPIEPGERGVLADIDLDPPRASGVALASKLEVEEMITSPYRAAAATQTAGEAEASGLSRTRAALLIEGSSRSPTRMLDRSVFPFRLPVPPGAGDNQALAVNTVDGASLIDVALSLIFVGQEVVGNSNEAYALASCVQCVTAALAFQVVIMFDEAQTLVPENLAVAVNAYCATCLTYAVAMQLVVSMADPLTPAQLADLERIWAELEALEGDLEHLSTDEVYATLLSIQEEILLVLGASADSSETKAGSDDNTAATPGSADEGASPTPEPTPTAEATPSPGASPSPEASPSPTPESSSSAEPSPSSDPSSTTEPEPSPTP